MKTYEDKRTHARRPHLKTLYVERLSAPPEKRGRSYSSAMAQGTDISQGGIGLVTPHAFDPGEAVRLLFPMPDLTVNLPVAAGVIWSKPEGDKFRSGLQFMS
jgi:Tfp pilus assembly protein PilZ